MKTSLKMHLSCKEEIILQYVNDKCLISVTGRFKISKLKTCSDERNQITYMIIQNSLKKFNTNNSKNCNKSLLPEIILLGGSRGDSGSYGMLRHPSQNSVKVENGCPS